MKLWSHTTLRRRSPTSMVNPHACTHECMRMCAYIVCFLCIFACICVCACVSMYMGHAHVYAYVRSIQQHSFTRSVTKCDMRITCMCMRMCEASSTFDYVLPILFSMHAATCDEVLGASSCMQEHVAEIFQKRNVPSRQFSRERCVCGLTFLLSFCPGLNI